MCHLYPYLRLLVLFFFVNFKGVKREIPLFTWLSLYIYNGRNIRLILWIENDIGNRLLCYKQDWTSGLRAGAGIRYVISTYLKFNM